MAKYRIAWLPGDGIGVDVMEAAKIVLDRIGLDAEYHPRGHRLGILARRGRCVSRPHNRAPEERRCRHVRRHHVQAPEARRGGPGGPLQGKGLQLPLADRPHAAVVRPLHLPAALQGLSWQPAELQGRHRPRHLPRKHRGSVRRSRVLARCRRSWLRRSRKLSKPFAPFSRAAARQIRRVLQDQHAEEFGAHRPRRVRLRPEVQPRKKVTVVHKANVVRATDGLFLEAAREVAKDYPEIRLDEANIDALTMWLLKNPSTTTCSWRRTSTATSSPTCARRWSAGWASAARATSARSWRSSSRRTARRQSTPGSTRSTRSRRSLTAKMMLDWLGEADKGARVEQAVAAVIAEGKVRTYDMGGSAKTLEMAEAIAAKL